MKDPKIHFMISLVGFVLVTILLLQKFAPPIHDNIYAIFARDQTIQPANYTVLIEREISKIKSVQPLTENYNEIGAIQQELVKNISEFSEIHAVRITSMPKLHQITENNTISSTIQIQIEGDAKTQLLLLQYFEQNLRTLPLKNYTLQTRKKKKEKHLFGLYTFQYKTNSNPNK